jgi:NAD+ synthase (glutamine-hydrolysing)
MRILIAQLNPIIGDLKGNTQLILQAIAQGRAMQADLVLFSELILTGYPPEDLVLNASFMRAVEEQLQEIIQATADIAVIIGLPRRAFLKNQRTVLFNSAAFIHDQQFLDYSDKILLPTYDVFDEKRYFQEGEKAKVWSLHGVRFAVTICEDIWQHTGVQACTYTHNPIEKLKQQAFSFVLNLSASPYSVGKFAKRVEAFANVSRFLETPIVMCNQVGGNDSLLFDGRSFLLDSQGNIRACAKAFVEDDLIIEIEPFISFSHAVIEQKEDWSSLYQALVMGTRDYFRKQGLKKACFGLSGGIDSALVACIVKEALGAEQVLALYMPSRYSSIESSRDALQLAQNLEIIFQQISIESIFESYLSLLKPIFANTKEDVTEENIQARIRATLLMAMANKFGYVVVCTGNKSELALGYSTLYGDMAGGLALLGDITKQQVYGLARWINRKKEIIPLYIIERSPSAELRDNQKDSDTLPDYSLLDSILVAYLEENRSMEWMADQFDCSKDVIQDIIKRIHANEYKRRQAPPVLRVSEKAFGVGRRHPIVQRWV